RALGFPTEMFTVLYAIARTAGWIAHWQEMIDDPSQRIGRPRQLYTGATERTYVPMESRSYSVLTSRLAVRLLPQKRRICGWCLAASHRDDSGSQPSQWLARSSCQVKYPTLHKRPTVVHSRLTDLPPWCRNR